MHPVGCVPPIRWPYPIASHVSLFGVSPTPHVCLRGGVYPLPRCRPPGCRVSPGCTPSHGYTSPPVMWPVIHAGKPTPLWSVWQTRAKTLPCSKLCLRAVEKTYAFATKPQPPTSLNAFAFTSRSLLSAISNLFVQPSCWTTIKLYKVTWCLLKLNAIVKDLRHLMKKRAWHHYFANKTTMLYSSLEIIGKQASMGCEWGVNVNVWNWK